MRNAFEISSVSFIIPISFVWVLFVYDLLCKRSKFIFASDPEPLEQSENINEYNWTSLQNQNNFHKWGQRPELIETFDVVCNSNYKIPHQYLLLAFYCENVRCNKMAICIISGMRLQNHKQKNVQVSDTYIQRFHSLAEWTFCWGLSCCVLSNVE